MSHPQQQRVNQSAGAGHPVEEQNGSEIMIQTEEIRRQSEGQRLRCRNILKKLKIIQLEELEEYGEEQMESAITTIGKSKGISFPEVKLPTFLQRKPPVANNFDDEDQDIDRLVGPNIYNTNLYERKKGMESVRDVAIKVKTNMKETMFSTAMLANELYETDPGSDYEDEFEAKASVKGHRDKEDFQGYLPVEANPTTKWARKRHEILTRWKWLQDGLRNVDNRLKQTKEIIRHLAENKPEFQFDETPNAGRKQMAISMSAQAALKDATIKVYHETKKIDRDLGPDGTPIFFGYKQKPNGIYNTEGRTVIPSTITEKVNFHPASLKKDGVLSEESNKDLVGGGLEGLKLRILDPFDPATTARRCLPMKSFRPRKIYQLGGVHNIIGRPIRQLTSLCNCYGRTELCVICTGRSDKMKPVRSGTVGRKQASALLDHTYHKVLCTSDQKPLRRLLESSLKTEEWSKSLSVKQSLTTRYDSSSEEESSTSDVEILKPIFLHTKPVRILDLISPPSPVKKVRQYRPRSEKKVVRETPTKKSRKRRRTSGDADEDDDEEEEDVGWTPTKRPKSSVQDFIKRRRTDEKYDIDHIVIPYSIAAATRVEKIEYKEIMIPSWRVNPIEPLSRPAPIASTSRLTRRRWRSSNTEAGLEEDGFEDVSAEAILARHHRSELEEKQRFLKAVNKLSNRRARRSESKAENPEGAPSVSPTLEINETEMKPVVDEAILPLPSTSNQISLADASLAVTALKISNANVARRRTVSGCKIKIEDEETEDPGFPPYELRKFPLSENEYTEMVTEMEAAYKESERMGISSFESPTKSRSDAIDYDDSDEDKLADPDWNDNPPDEQPPTPSVVTKLNRRSKRGSLTPVLNEAS